MAHMNCFKDLFEAILDYRKIVLFLFLIKKDADLLTECDYLKSDINSLNKEPKNIILEQNEENLGYIDS